MTISSVRLGASLNAMHSPSASQVTTSASIHAAQGCNPQPPGCGTPPPRGTKASKGRHSTKASKGKHGSACKHGSRGKHGTKASKGKHSSKATSGHGSRGRGHGCGNPYSGVFNACFSGWQANNPNCAR